MRIAFLSTFYPFRGGIAQFNANLYEAIRAAGHEAKAFTFTCQYPKILFPGKTQFVAPQDNAKPVESTRILNSINPFSWRRTAREILRWKPDLVVFGYWMSFFAPSQAAVARMLRRHGVKVETVVHNAIPHDPRFFDKPLARKFFRRNDGLVSMCNAVTADIRRLCPDAQVVQHPHPIYDHFGARLERQQAMRQLGLDPQRRTLLFFGLIRDYKGLDLLIDALPLLGPEYQLVIAGESYGSFDRYRAQIDASGCADRIHLQNRYIGDEEVPLFFSAADLCVLPYRSATQSGITAISLHFDLPLVATPVGGLPESVGETGVGVMAREASAEAIAEAVRRYFSGEGAGCRAAIAAFKERATWQRFAEEVVLLAERI